MTAGTSTDLGTVLSGVFHGPGTVVPKGVCVRLGEHGELATCFNPETLNYEAVWQGGFLKFSDVRHGFLDGLAPSGDMLPRPDGETPEQPFVYHGFYRLGRRVVFAYRIGDVEMLDSPWVKDGKFERDVAPAAEHPLRDALRGGPPQWPEKLRQPRTLGLGQSLRGRHDSAAVRQSVEVAAVRRRPRFSSRWLGARLHDAGRCVASERTG